MLYTRRKRLRERAEAEAKGESFWTGTFDAKVRTRLFYAARDAATSDWLFICELARDLILKDEGIAFLSNAHDLPHVDFSSYFMGCPHDEMPTVIESVYVAMNSYDNTYGSYVIQFHEFGKAVHEILEEERVAFDFADGQMVPFESKELYQAVMEPAMKLLHNPSFSEAEKAYQHALEEVTSGKPGDAITDAGTALQETLNALGCEGNSLGPLIKSAKAKGLLVAHDARMTKAIEDVMEWVSADRSEKGDSHKADAAQKEDAWLIIHVVGALIVRLVGASVR
jgi:hypothetical protein